MQNILCKNWQVWVHIFQELTQMFMKLCIFAIDLQTEGFFVHTKATKNY